MTDQQLADGMRRLVSQIATPNHLLEVARTAKARGFMRFNEWPSGHWALTNKGRNFLAEVDE